MQMTELDQARTEINRVNLQLMKLLEQRFNAVNQVNHYKYVHHLPILDSKREQDVLNQVRQHVKDSDQATFITNIFQVIMQESRAYQATLRKKGKD